MQMPPNHTIATDTQFMMSIMHGIMNVMTRFVNSCVFMRLRLASSKRASSCFSRPNARTTGRPVNVSRATRFTRSMSFCMTLNFGMAAVNSTSTRASTATTATTMIHAIDTFVCVIMMMPPMPRIGA